MEAASRLFSPDEQPVIRALGDRLAIERLLVEDATAARLARERQEAGEDAARLVADAIAIGARVLDREQAGADVEFVRHELESASREIQDEFQTLAQGIAGQLGEQLTSVFGPDEGMLARSLARHFSDDSAGAVQHRVREVVAELMAKSREDMQRLFAADDPTNPLAAFQRTTLALMKQSAEQQGEHLRHMGAKLAELQEALARQQEQARAAEELEAERERGTAKGDEFEVRVFEAIDAIALAQGDVASAVGDLPGAIDTKGDVIVDIDAAAGVARGRIVFEAKDQRLSRPKMLAELDGALRNRDADFAVLVVPAQDELPAGTQPLREFGGDKLIVVVEADAAGRAALDVAYRLARARVLMSRGGAEGLDSERLEELVERAEQAIAEARNVRTAFTKTETALKATRETFETLVLRVAEPIAEIDALCEQARGAGE